MNTSSQKVDVIVRAGLLSTVEFFTDLGHVWLILLMVCDLFGCECGRYIAANKCVKYLDTKWKLKSSDSEINVVLVNVNVDITEGLQIILTKIIEG